MYDTFVFYCLKDFALDMDIYRRMTTKEVKTYTDMCLNYQSNDMLLISQNILINNKIQNKKVRFK